MPNHSHLPFSFPAIRGKKVTAAFDGGRLSSDGGVMLLCEAERQLGIAARLAALFPDERDGTRVIHRVSDMIRARIFAIACGYEDCNDFETLRSDPVFKLACGRRPDSDPDLASQPTLSRLENASGIRDAIRLTYALIDQWMAGIPRAGCAALVRRVSTAGAPAPLISQAPLDSIQDALASGK